MRKYRVYLKQLRKSKGWSQEYAAELLGISASFLKQIENCQRNPTITFARKIADLYGVGTIDEILEAS